MRALAQMGDITRIEEHIALLREQGYPEVLLRQHTPKSQQNTGLRASQEYLHKWNSDTRNIGTTSPCPLVSIIVVSYNSGKDLALLLPTIKTQTYRHWELIIIENGGDDTEPGIKEEIGSYKYIKAKNPGFAEANNIGLEQADGELVLLLNPDTRLASDTLKELVHGMRIDSSAAAACPLIYFWAPFCKLSIESSHGGAFMIDVSKLISSQSYRKMLVRDGDLIGDGRIGSSRNGKISIDIAIDPDCQEIELTASAIDVAYANEKTIRVEFEGSGERPKVLTLPEKPTTIALEISDRVHSSARNIINNAGSGIREESDTPYDIGFGEVDAGQYSGRAYVQAFCGCCVLLRRDLFISRKIFVSEFFAYYEDSELSYWIRANHMNILYLPSAHVYHRHSESTSENSPTWRALVGRSQQIYSFMKKGDAKFRQSEHLSCLLHRDLDVAASIRSRLGEYDLSLEGRIPGELIRRTAKKTLGIYNSYWSSMGGGEKHALDFAEVALELGIEVYLVCETEFSVPELESYFNKALKGAKKLVCGEVTESLTQRFDVFVNSTYLSSLRSRAAISYYIVSFPQREINKDVLSSYKFLHNSHFTRSWARKYWGEHNEAVLMPVIGFANTKKSSLIAGDIREGASTKTRIILSVGRFNYSGHCKNHHLTAKVFKRLSSERKINEEWKLVIVGSYNISEDSSIRHYNDTKEILVGTNSQIIGNASRQALVNLYKSASIYVHAAGLGVSEKRTPEECEHFGIAVYESLLYGCNPIVHGSGGPGALVRQIGTGHVYGDCDSLAKALISATTAIDTLNDEEALAASVQATNKAFLIAKDAHATARQLLRGKRF